MQWFGGKFLPSHTCHSSVYHIVLIVPMVMTMDALSGWLRRVLIKGSDGAFIGP